MFTPASLYSNQTAALTVVVRGLRLVARGYVCSGACAKQGFSHVPNSPEFGSEAER
jgi:hypothetical protein